jgi:hypothetical protein
MAVCVLIFTLVFSGCSAEKRARPSNVKEQADVLWSVRLRNEKSGAQKTLEVRAPTSERAVDSALLQARDGAGGWGSAPIALLGIEKIL